MTTYRPEYLTVVDLFDCHSSFGIPIESKLIDTVECFDMELALYYNRYPANMYMSIGGYCIHIRPETWETKDRPCQFVVELFDRAGLQYIRFVIHMDKGYKKAGAFFVEIKDSRLFITPLCNLHPRIKELKEQERKTRTLSRPYTPRLDKLSALGKSKEYFYSKADLELYRLSFNLHA